MKKIKKTKKILLSILVVIMLCVGMFFLYILDYYPADKNALATIAKTSTVSTIDNALLLSPPISSDTALIFYPGAKVEHTAYLPILDKITTICGIHCILVEMPYRMAIFDSNAANNIIAAFPEIQNWYIGGHSMGGAMASAYASNNQEKIKGLILMGAYLYGDYPSSQSLTIYGTFNANLEKHINYTDNIIVIEGGNHAQFGNYGKQKGDPDATITTDKQQNIAVDAIKDFFK